MNFTVTVRKCSKNYSIWQTNKRDFSCCDYPSAPINPEFYIENNNDIETTTVKLKKTIKKRFIYEFPQSCSIDNVPNFKMTSTLVQSVFYRWIFYCCSIITITIIGAYWIIAY